MGCKKCDAVEVNETGITYFRVGNKDIGYGNIGIIACDDHAKLIQKILRQEVWRTPDGQWTDLLERPIPASNSITSFFHCRECINEIIKDTYDHMTGKIECGYTLIGFQVRCIKHNLNLIHLDMLGNKFPATTKGVDE